jgi:hypothetical protein
MIINYRKRKDSRPPGNLTRVIAEKTQGKAVPADRSWDAAVVTPAPAKVPDRFSEGDRVKLAKPFWGVLDQDKGVLVRDASGAEKGEPPTYEAGSQGTVIYLHPAPPAVLWEMQTNGNYIVSMDDGQEIYSTSPTGLPWANTDLERIPGQYQVTHHNRKSYVRPKFNAFDRVRLRDAFVCLDDGKRYEAGWKGKIFPFATTITECWATDLYEVSLDGDRGMVTVHAESLVLIPPGTETGLARNDAGAGRLTLRG